MQDLKVTLVQTSLFWEDIEANLEMFDAKLDRLASPTDLIILPEMFSTGFSMHPQKLAETMDGRAVSWARAKARSMGVVITGSLMIKEGDAFYNRLIWVRPDGGLATYDKKHLFRYAGEHKVYRPGERLLTVGLKGWKIRPFICYDLRFPLWTRNFDNAYDLAIFVANWPERRSAHWRSLLPARAIENQAYVIGVNRIGNDGNGYYHSGDSAVINPAGRMLFTIGHAPCTRTIKLSAAAVTEYRKGFPAWQDADKDLADLPCSPSCLPPQSD